MTLMNLSMMKTNEQRLSRITAQIPIRNTKPQARSPRFLPHRQSVAYAAMLEVLG